MNEVGQDTLEKWTIRKAKVIKKKSGECELRYGYIQNCMLCTLYKNYSPCTEESIAHNYVTQLTLFFSFPVQ